MFLSKNRRKSEKKVTKKDKGRDRDLSMKVCKQKTITSSRVTAGSEGTILNSDKRFGENQNKLRSSNSVGQCTDTQPISSHVFESSTSNSISDSIGEICNGEKVNRRTYSLEQVSKSLDQVMASGKAILEALASANGTEYKSSDGNILLNTSETNSGRDLTKRGTYDLSKVSDLLDTSVDNGSTLEASLNNVSQDSPNKSLSTSSIQRKTYELDTVSTKLDQSFEQNTSLEEILYELSLDNAQNNSVSSPKLKRATYDLEKIETTLDESLNSDKSMEESTEQIETDSSPRFNRNRRNTYDLSDVSSQQDHSIDMSTLSESSDRNTATDQSTISTSNLSNVLDLLNGSVNSGKNIDESLDQISSMELKRRTYDLTDKNLELTDEPVVESIKDNNNTIRATKQSQASMDENSYCDLLSSDNLSTEVGCESEKQSTYVLDESDVRNTSINSENSSENGNCDNPNPVDVLLEFGLDREDGQREMELTPRQWIEQMKGLKTPPALTTPPPLSPLKLKLNPKEVFPIKRNASVKASKQISEVTQKKPRSQTVSGESELNSRSDSEIRTRSMSDSKVRSQLKSSSSPNFSTSTRSSNKVAHSESLEDISPGIRNYLANKLGLSKEQCIAVHRRLSSGSETVLDASKLAKRKTYSLDDVAHSLDIATSQGLPMTEVLDNLDATTDKTENGTSLANVKDTNQKLNRNSNNLEGENTTSSVQNDSANTKPQTVDLESATPQSSTNHKTYILSNGSSLVDGSPTGKTSTLDNQFKLVRKKAVYKPSAKLQSFSHLLGGKGGHVLPRKARGKTDPLKRNTYTLESVAESLEKAQDAGVPMLDALKRLSGSSQGLPSELPEEKRQTYNLEDLSNTLETAAAAGVPFVDTLQTIADPSNLADPGKDEVFETQKQEDEVLETAKPPPKRKPPPKPKRTFSNSSKPEIKSVSDSFVIEYYTSPPKRSQSDSSVQNRKSETRGNESVTSKENYNVKTEEKFYVNQSTVDETIDGKSVLSSNKSQSENDKAAMQENKVPSPKFRNIEDQKPTTRVVSDLDSLILKLAAEVQKPTNVDIPLIETNMERSLICPSSDLVSNTKPELSCTKLEIPNTKGEFLNTKPDFPSTKSDLSSTKPDFSSTKHDFSNTKPEFPSTKPDFSGTNADFSNTKPDDEGYCSLSRKPGTRSMKLEHGSQIPSEDLFKKDKLITALEESNKVEIICSYDNAGETQECTIELTAEEDSGDQIADSDSNVSPKADPVSRELNLLRLRLAEKQRDIEAQKRRTKEQLEEERKRFGQNVFWLAVGKGRERKEGNETNSPKKSLHQQRLPTNQTSNASNLEPSNDNKFTTFTKQSSLDEDLPPSMGKLQDRTYNKKNDSLNNTKSIPEQKGPLPDSSVEHRQPSVQDRKASVQDRKTPMELRNPSVEDRNSSEDVVQFRLSRQAPGTRDVVLNKEQQLGKTFPENSEFQNSEKPKTSVLNYKSRVNVPVSIQTKPVSENYPDSENSQNLADGYRPGNENFPELDVNSENLAIQPTSPQRKCWDAETVIHSEPCIAVSESNVHVFDQNQDKNSETPEKARVLDNEMYKDGRVVEDGARSYSRSGSNSSGEQDAYFNMGGVKQSPDEGDGSLPSSPVEEDRDTPKKGLTLFIGEENTVSNNDGSTPEQLKKREKFLRNRQQKIEEDKLKKEALLEKKRRKEEKMREIQLGREQEEQSRHARLQEKREQAEHAKQERQKYEMRKKENLPRTNFMDGGHTRITQGISGVPGGNAGYNRTTVDKQEIEGGNGRYTRTVVKTPTKGGNAFEIHAPAQPTTPSAFSGFTGVQSYVKPSGKTNRKLIMNAISHVCLPGAINKDTKEKCLQAMTESSAQHFLILFKEGLKFRALYSLDLESNQVLKVHGIGPRSVTEKMIEQLYKYNSGGKEFSKIPAKGFSLSVDGFTLQKSCWQSNKPSVSSKTSSNYKQSTYRSAR